MDIPKRLRKLGITDVGPGLLLATYYAFRWCTTRPVHYRIPLLPGQMGYECRSWSSSDHEKDWYCPSQVHPQQKWYSLWYRETDADEGNRAHVLFQFCPICGATQYWSHPRIGDRERYGVASFMTGGEGGNILSGIQAMERRRRRPEDLTAEARRRALEDRCRGLRDQLASAELELMNFDQDRRLAGPAYHRLPPECGVDSNSS